MSRDLVIPGPNSKKTSGIWTEIPRASDYKGYVHTGMLVRRFFFLSLVGAALKIVLTLYKVYKNLHTRPVL